MKNHEFFMERCLALGKKAFPNNVAPYFDIDPETKYCKDNGYHAPPEEHEIYVQNLIDFIGKI